MSRTFGEILSDYMKLHDELQNKVFDDVIYAERVAVVRCKDCKYFELDHFKRIYDVPIITAHEICTKWGGGCKTRQDGFCFMGERREK